jgi:hypothetical protein|tara:strand:- start:2100 stop:2576 length:477 start_codon:yes stop_codon:yes gene_type:complete
MYGYPVGIPMVFDAPTEIRTARPPIEPIPEIEGAATSGLRILTGAKASKDFPGLPDISKAGVPEPSGPSRINADALDQAKYNRDLKISTDRFKAMRKNSKYIAKAKDRFSDEQAKYFNPGGFAGRGRSAQNKAMQRAKAWRSAAYGMRPDARQYLTYL